MTPTLPFTQAQREQLLRAIETASTRAELAHALAQALGILLAPRPPRPQISTRGI